MWYGQGRGLGQGCVRHEGRGGCGDGIVGRIIRVEVGVGTEEGLGQLVLRIGKTQE